MALTCCITSPSGSFGFVDARANRIVAFAHRLQQIRQGTQRPGDAPVCGEAETEPAQHNHNIDRPLDSRRDTFNGQYDDTSE